jgi:hypothetical protein
MSEQQKEVRIQLTDNQNSAIREDNIIGSQSMMTFQAEIAGLEAEIESKKRLIEARQVSMQMAANSHKRFTDAIVKDAGTDPAKVEKYIIEDKDGKHFMVLTLKPTPEPSADELQKQKAAALNQKKGA